jgi:hypothetical protein
MKDEALKLALEAHQAMREWIDAVPDDTVLPAMPGCDRDWLDTVEATLKQALAAPVQETPFQIGQRLRQEGKGISDLWGAVSSDADMPEAQRGFDSAAQPAPTDGWLQEGSLLYRLTDGRKPQNRDEINVTMADESRSVESCTRRAGELLDRIRANPPAAQPAVPLTDEQIEAIWYDHHDREMGYAMRFARAIEAAHGITKGQP